MTASATDVRQWFREQGRGEEVGTRGAISQHLREEYEQAHRGGVVQGELLDDDYPPAPATGSGVTEADFPPDDDEPGGAAPAATAGHKIRGERRPRKVQGGKPRRLTERLFGGGKPAGRGKHARVNLGDFAEETWTDLAWLAAPIPPLAAILQIQAPYAGVVFDDAVKGTPVDVLCQPAARYAGSFRALNGLAGPPVYTALICMTGQRVQATDETGKPAVDQLGNPVMVPDTRTQMLFQGLRYSLLQMTKIADVRAEEIAERTTTMNERMKAVDAMINAIFGDMTGPQSSPPGAPSPAQESSPAGNHRRPDGYQYPVPPVMDGTGADPGRL